MPNIFASCIFAVLDPLLTLVGSATTNTVDYISSRTTSTREDPKKQQEDPLRQCRFPIDDSPPSTITLPDSRILSYAQYGSRSPSAHTVFFLHGWPGSRTEATFLDATASKHNVRIIGIDRPGVGLSTPDASRTVLSHTKDIEHLAVHLHADRYGILGVSGGGPYALACAKTLPPEKLPVVSIVVGLGPSDIGYWGMYLLNYLGWNFSPLYLPRFTRWWFSREPISRLDLSRQERFDMMRRAFEKAKARGSMLPQDVKTLGDEDVMKVQIRLAEDVNLQSTPWVMQDMRLLGTDLGFKVEDIRKDLRVQMWYGRKDGNVPLKHGVEVARRLRRSSGSDGQRVDEEEEKRVNLRIIDDATHASLFFDYQDDFMGEIARAMEHSRG